MIIDYPAGKKLVLRVRDTNTLDRFAVFVNGTLRDLVADGQLHEFEIERPVLGAMAIAIHFQGNDGGTSGIVDVTNPASETQLDSRTGLLHSYILKAAP